MLSIVGYYAYTTPNPPQRGFFAINFYLTAANKFFDVNL